MKQIPNTNYYLDVYGQVYNKKNKPKRRSNEKKRTDNAIPHYSLRVNNEDKCFTIVTLYSITYYQNKLLKHIGSGYTLYDYKPFDELADADENEAVTEIKGFDGYYINGYNEVYNSKGDKLPTDRNKYVKLYQGNVGYWFNFKKYNEEHEPIDYNKPTIESFRSKYALGYTPRELALKYNVSLAFAEHIYKKI